MIRPSTCGVVSVPTIPAPTLGPFYTAPSDSWIRLLVRNVGGNPVYLAFVTNAANTTNVTTDRYELPAGMSVRGFSSRGVARDSSIPPR